MNHDYIKKALFNLVPTAEWTLSGADIVWYSEDISKPTSDEISVEIEKIKAQELAEEYKEKRKSEYPPIEDFIDAMYWDNMGDPAPLEAYMEKVTYVKNKYPKFLG